MNSEQKLNMTMLCDFYELTMANGYFHSGHKDCITYFDVFFRDVPDKGGFAICAPFGMSGKSFVNNGLSTRAKRSMTPPFSPIFMMPSHKDSTPVNPREISNAVFEELNVELMISGNTPVSPRKTRRKVAMMNAIRKKAIQM